MSEQKTKTDKDPKIGIKHRKYDYNAKQLARQYMLEINATAAKWDCRILMPEGKHGIRKQCHRQTVRAAEGKNLARRLSIKYRVPEGNVRYVNNANDTAMGIQHEPPKDTPQIEAPTETD